MSWIFLLEANGVVSRKVMPTSPPTVEYCLTDLGRELKPAIQAIALVGHRIKQSRGQEVGNGPAERGAGRRKS